MGVIEGAMGNLLTSHELTSQQTCESRCAEPMLGTALLPCHDVDVFRSREVDNASWSSRGYHNLFYTASQVTVLVTTIVALSSKIPFVVEYVRSGHKAQCLTSTM